jgi:hypothetical protein
MNVFTKRNALIGYLALTALQRRRWQRRRSRMKIAAYVALALISFGILAWVAAVAFRRLGGVEEAEAAEAAEASEPETGETEPEPEVVGEFVTAGTEPIPAA